VKKSAAKGDKKTEKKADEDTIKIESLNFKVGLQHGQLMRIGHPD
jgi:hypothetical protein